MSLYSAGSDGEPLQDIRQRRTRRTSPRHRSPAGSFMTSPVRLRSSGFGGMDGGGPASMARISEESRTQSVQMKTPGPATSLRTWSRGLPQKEQLICVCRRFTASA